MPWRKFCRILAAISEHQATRLLMPKWRLHLRERPIHPSPCEWNRIIFSAHSLSKLVLRLNVSFRCRARGWRRARALSSSSCSFLLRPAIANILGIYEIHFEKVEGIFHRRRLVWLSQENAFSEFEEQRFFTEPPQATSHFLRVCLIYATDRNRAQRCLARMYDRSSCIVNGLEAQATNQLIVKYLSALTVFIWLPIPFKVI